MVKGKTINIFLIDGDQKIMSFKITINNLQLKKLL